MAIAICGYPLAVDDRKGLLRLLAVAEIAEWPAPATPIRTASTIPTSDAPLIRKANPISPKFVLVAAEVMPSAGRAAPRQAVVRLCRFGARRST